MAGKAETKKKILIVDDHPIVRRGLAHLINQENDLVVCAEAEDERQALDLARRYKPALATVDLVLKTSSGIDLVKELRRLYPMTAVLVVSMYDENTYAERALRAGARGYVMKHEVDEIIVEAIRRILSGRLYLSEAIGERILLNLARDPALHSEPSVEGLSDRELEVFRSIGSGVKTRAMADRMHVSVKTVETYRSRIKAKLHLTTSSQLAQFAVEWLLHEDKSH